MSEALSIAIIGAGVSGLAAASTLLEAGHKVVVYEKSQSLGGRVATSKRSGFIYDHGAQYVKQVNAEGIRLITDRFRTPDLITIEKPIWIFDGQGQIQEGDAQQNATPRWCYRSGMSSLPHMMSVNLPVRLETPIDRIEQTPTGWLLFSNNSDTIQEYDALLITIPAPQATLLLNASKLADTLQQSINAHLSHITYNALLSITLGYKKNLRTRPYYALVNTDKAHDLSWLAWEHEKSPERAPAGTGLLIAQMAPQYSAEHFADHDLDLAQDITQQVSKLLQEELNDPSFIDVQRWHYALPSHTIDANELNHMTLPYKLAFCGDGFVGGRVQLALEHGIAVSKQIASAKMMS